MRVKHQQTLPSRSFVLRLGHKQVVEHAQNQEGGKKGQGMAGNPPACLPAGHGHTMNKSARYRMRILYYEQAGCCLRFLRNVHRSIMGAQWLADCYIIKQLSARWPRSAVSLHSDGSQAKPVILRRSWVELFPTRRFMTRDHHSGQFLNKLSFRGKIASLMIFFFFLIYQDYP